MGTTAASTWDDASQWRIHLRREAWPQRAGARFIVGAIDDVLRTLWRFGTEDLIDDFEETGGYRNAVSGFFHKALMNGSMMATAHPSRGGPPRPIPPTDWTPDIVDLALATGMIEKREGGKRDAMWVFIDAAELALMLKVLSITDMLHQPEERGPLEHMGDIVLAGMHGIADAGRPRDDRESAERLMRLLLRTIPHRLDDIDMASVVTAVATLLREKFDADPRGLLKRADFEVPIRALYGPHLSERMFTDAWREATRWEDEAGEQPHMSRRDRGRRRKA